MDENTARIQRAFTAQAQGFESPRMNFAKRDYLTHLITCTQPSPTDRFLEVAAGTCACGRAFAPHLQSVTCFDMTEAMLAIGRAEAQKAGLTNLSFIQGNAETLPFADSTFDIVLSRLAIHHFPNPQRCVAEMARVLKPGGKLVLIDMEATEESLRSTEDAIETLRDPSHIRNPSRAELEALFASNAIRLTYQDCHEIPVDLSAWLTLTHTPAEVAAVITHRLTAELAGGPKTGLFPYKKGENLAFNQHWLLLIGQK